MINVKGRLRRERQRAEINMAPMLDMVFILLIFFLVTTSFVRESGVEVQRPAAKTVQAEESGSLRLGINQAGQVFAAGRQVDVRSVRAIVERFLAENPDGSVLIVADREAKTGITVRVLDFCRLAGATRVAVAATRES
ncbi:MAG: biopolymer transporter ExbD [Deltaproteobacteria bacterium]|nr:biopolymer transporter ExbD [Candidatus Anaeroferrophillus wilburensis]MBN2889838.1 biopolymer transporter ExbD [Deltaproteobacteria bacterium]